MIFKPELAALILVGGKTQTRRVVKEGDRSTIFSPYHAIPQSPDCVQRNGRILWQVGRVYAVQPGRGKSAVAHFLLEGIRYCARAGDISEDDAHAEGFENAATFCAVYGQLNGGDALDKPCWALTFHLIEDAEGA